MGSELKKSGKSEIEVLNGILVKVSGHKLESSQTQDIVWVSIFVFLFYKMLLMNRPKFSCFADFFVWCTAEYGFL